MSQIRIFDYHAPRTTDLLNTKFERTLPESVTDGMTLSKGTGNFDINIGTGTWLCDGVVLYESATLTDSVTLDAPGSSPRIDVVYGSFTYVASTSTVAATYHVSKGTPGATPVEPTLTSHQVKLAAIYVPTSASDLDDCQIEQAYTLKEQLLMLLGVKTEANLWVRGELDPFVPTGNPTASLIKETQIEDGDLWIDTSGLDLYIYDADNNEWVSSDVSTHATTHSCTGSDPIDVKNLCDSLSYLHQGTKSVHDALGLSHTHLSDVTADQHHPQDHSSRHACTGADALDISNLCDTGSWLHKHATALSPCPHGNECHSVSYAEDPHSHAAHTGILSRGQIGFTTFAGDMLPTGSGCWSMKLPRLAVANTSLKIIELYASVDSAPTSNLAFTVKQNGVSIGTVTIVGGSLSGTTDIPDVTISNGDTITLDAPSSDYGATGLCFYASMEREAA